MSSGKNILRLFLFLLILLSPLKDAYAQCEAGVPTFTVDLSADPSGVWESGWITRANKCCGNDQRCVRFIVTLHPDAERIAMNAFDGALPEGALDWRLTCGSTPVPVGTPACVSGVGPHDVIFCKPGNNQNRYRITSIAKPSVSPPTYVSDGCSGVLSANGYELNSIIWNQVGSSDGQNYNHYLSCTANCDNVTVTAETGYPEWVDYQVSGVPLGGCGTDRIDQVVRVTFVTDKFVQIIPPNPVICFGGINTSATAQVTGGMPPYNYLWSNGATTQTISVGLGTYSVTVTDQTNCPAISEEVTVTANPSAVRVIAGPDVTSCENNPSIQLSSTVEIATQVVWSGGAGTYDDPNSLNPVYTPTAAEITAALGGTPIRHIVSTVDHTPCPIERDTLFQTIVPGPVVTVPATYSVCTNNPTISLAAATATNAASVEWIGGSGTFFPNRNTVGATYTATEAELAGSVVLTLRAYGNQASCAFVEQSTTISFTPAPTVSTIADISVCANNRTVNLGGTFGAPATGATWSGGTPSGFSDASSLTSTYTPTDAEVALGSVTLTLTTTGNGNCAPVSDNLTISINPAPVVNAGPDRTVCANNAAVTLNGAVSNAGSFVWSAIAPASGSFNNPNSLTATYTPSSADTAAGTVTLRLTSMDHPGCATVFDEMVITINKAPWVDAGNPQTVCANNATVSLSGTILRAASATWSGGTGTFANSTSLNTTYTPSATDAANGQAKLYLTTPVASGCATVRDSVLITIVPAPIVNTGGNVTVCANQPSLALNGTVLHQSGATTGEWIGGTGNFNPGRTTPGATYTPSAAEISAGTVTLRLRSTGNDGGLCNAVELPKVITINPAPIANAGANRSVCANNPTVTLAGQVTNATGGTWTGGSGTFAPDRNSLTATYTPHPDEITNLSTINLTLTTTGIDPTCAVATSNMSITITPAPVVTIPVSARTVCANNPTLSLSGTVTGATGGEWLNGNGVFNPGRTSLTPSYTLHASELTVGNVVNLTLRSTGNPGNCLAEQASMTITVTTPPTVSAGAPQTVCANNSSITLQGTYDASVSSGIEWLDGGGTFSPNRLAPNAVYTPSAAERSAGSVTLRIRTTGNNQCNAVIATVTHTITPAPVVTAGNDQVVCGNNADVTLNGTITGVNASGGVWSTLGTGTFNNAASLSTVYVPSADDVAAGEVILRLTSNAINGCAPVTSDLRVVITESPILNALTINDTKEINVCKNNPNVGLKGSYHIATGVEWYVGPGSSGTFNPGSTSLETTYIPTSGELLPLSVPTVNRYLYLRTTGNGNCNAVVDSVRINYGPIPNINAGPDQSACLNNAATTLAGVVPIGVINTWSGGLGTYSAPGATNNPTATYTPHQSELNAGFVELTLTGTRSGCLPISDVMRINFTPAPTADAGADREVCSNNPAVQLSGFVTIANGGVWSTSGTGTFSPNANTLNASYSPSPADVTNGSVVLTLTTTDNTGTFTCNHVSDQMTVTFTPAPTADAGGPTSICFNNAVVNLNGQVGLPATGGQWSSSGTGTFTPNINTLNAQYFPSDADKANGSVVLTLRTTGQGNCLPVTSNNIVTITPAPVVNAGTDVYSCFNNPTVTLNGSVTVADGGVWVGGNGIFSPDRNTLNATYTPTSAELSSATGRVTLTLISTGNGNCNQVSDQVDVIILPAPIVEAGSNQTLCGNVASVPLNGQITNGTNGIWSTSGTGTFSPNASALNASYIPSDADKVAGNVVTLTLTSVGPAPCSGVSDQLQLTFTSVPTVSAGPNKVVCTNDLPIQLEGSGSVSTWSGPGTFSPNNSTLNAVYTPTATEILNGSATLTLTTVVNGPCPAISSTVTISIPQGPVVNAGSDLTVCGDVIGVNLTGSVSNASGVVWSTDGTGTFSPQATNTSPVYVPSAADKLDGNIVLTITSTGHPNCSAVSDQMTLTITAPPTANAGPDMIRCADIAGFTLNGSVTVATGGTWTTTGSGTFNDVNLLNATYVPSQDDIDDGFVEFTLTTTGNGTCNAVSSTSRLTFTPAPTIDPLTNNTICADSAYVQLNATVNVATGGIWSTSGSGTFSPNETYLDALYYPSPADTAAGSVVLRLTTTGNGTCNPVFREMTLDITPVPVVNAGADQTICADATGVTLNGQVDHAGGGIWTTSGTGTFSDNQLLGAVYSPSPDDLYAGVVTLTLTSSNNGDCRAVTDVMVLTVTPAPTVNAGGNQTICADAVGVALNGQVTVATGGTWTRIGAGIPGTFADANALVTTYVPSQDDIDAGSVQLMLTTTGNGNCNPVSETITITITPAPTADAKSDITICGDVTDVQLDGEVTIATGGHWYTNNGTGYFSPSATDLNARYHPSATDIANGTVRLTLRTTGNGTCNFVEDFFDLTITPIPTVYAGDDQSVCGNNADIQLAGIVTVAGGVTWSGGTGTFSPDANALTGIYSPSQDEIDAGTVTLVLTSTDNGTCNAVSDYVNIEITPIPVVTTGGDRNVCANNATLNIIGSVDIATGGEWIGGTGLLTPNRNSLNITYTPSQDEIDAGLAVLTLSTTGNGNCLAETEEIRINISPAPVVDAGLDQTVCANNASVVLDGSFSNAGGVIWSGGTGTFTPSAVEPNATYIPSDNDKAAGIVNLTLTSTDVGNCLNTFDQMTITITPTPTVTPVAPQTICADVATVQLGAVLTVATEGIWTTTGTGTFDDPTSLNAIYTHSADDRLAGTVSFVMTTTDHAPCLPVNASTSATINPAPIVNAGADRTMCADAGIITLDGASVLNAGGGMWTTSGTGTFSPGVNAINASYAPSAADTLAGTVTLRLTSTDNGLCNAVYDEITITIDPAPLVSAGPDRTICADNNTIDITGAFVANASGGRWTTTGTGTFVPNAFAINPTYVPSVSDKAAGNVRLTITSEGNGLCNAVSDEMTLTFTPAPTANAGPNRTICSGSSVSLIGSVTNATGGIWSTASGTGTFSPAPTALNVTFTPTAAQIAAGQASIRLTTTGHPSCEPAISNMVLTIQPTPVVNPGFNQTVCETVAAVNLNGSVQHAGGGVWTTSGTGTFSPNANTLNAQYVPSAEDLVAGQITLTLTATGTMPCFPVSRSIIIRFTRQPTVDAGPASICSNASGVSLSGTFTNAGGIVWSTSGTGTFTPSTTNLTPTYVLSAADLASPSVTITLTSTDHGACNAATDNIVINVTPPPTVDPGFDQVICANNPGVTLNGAFGGTATGAVWSSSGGGPFSPSNTNMNPVYTLSAADLTNGFANITLTSTGTGACAPVSRTIRLTITPAPTVNAGSDRTVCADSLAIPISGTMTIASQGVWTTTGGASGTFGNANLLSTTYTPSAADTTAGEVVLRLTTTDHGNCLAVYDDVRLILTPAPTINAGPDVTACGDIAAYAFNAITTVATGGSWTAPTGSFMNPDELTTIYYLTDDIKVNGGTVTLTVTSSGNGLCKAVSDDVVLTVTPAPVINAGAANVCADSPTIPLNATVLYSAGVKWTTSGTGTFDDDESLTAIYTPSVNDKDVLGSVVLTVTTVPDASDLCMEIADSIIINFGNIPLADADIDQIVCANNREVTLNGSVANALGGEWSTLGSGTFADALDLGTVYTPSDADTLAGAVTLVLTTTGNGNCNASTDTMLVTITPAPFVDAGPAVVCANSGVVDLEGIVTVATGGIWTSSGDGLFGDPTALSTTYTLSVTDLSQPSITLTLTSTGNGDCNPVSDFITLYIEPAPIVNILSVDQVVCADTAFIQLESEFYNAVGGVWSTLGTGTFNMPGQTNTNYYPSDADTTAGSVRLVYTSVLSNSCIPVSDTITIDFTPAPRVEVTTGVVCANNGSVNVSAIYSVAGGVTWSTSGVGTFGDENSASTTYTLQGNDVDQTSILLTVTTTNNGDCKAVTDQVVLYITETPWADARADLSVCADTAGIVLDGLYNTAASGGAEWSVSGFPAFSTDMNAIYVPTAADTANGSVTLRLTTTDNGNCLPVFDEMTITITPAPVLIAGDDMTICADEPSVNIAGTINTAVSTFAWRTSGTGTFGNINSLATTYSPSDADTAAHQVFLILESLTQGDCKPVSDTLVLNILPAPVVDAGPASICANTVGVPMNGIVLHAGGGTWTTSGSGTFAPNANTLNAVYVISQAERDDMLPVTLTLTSTGNGRCQTYSDQIILNITPPPTANAGADVEICANVGGLRLNGSVTEATGGIWTTSGDGTFEDFDTDLDAFYVPSSADTAAGFVILRLTTTGMEPCIPVFDEMRLSFTPAPVAIVNAGNDTTLCADYPEVPLTGYISVASGGRWETNGTGFFTPGEYDLNSTYIPSAADIAAGSVRLRLRTTGNGDCVPVSDSILVTYLQRPLADAGIDFAVCADLDQIPLNGTVTNANGALWISSGSGAFVDATDENTSYIPSEDDKLDGFVILTLSTTGSLACEEHHDNVRVTINPRPVVNPGYDITVCGDAGTIQLNGEVLVAGGGTWTTSSSTGTFSDPDDLAAIYTLTAEDTTAGSVRLTLTSTDNDLCQPVARFIDITITDAPTITAGPDLVICGDSLSVTLSGDYTVATGGLWSTSGSGSFAPGINAKTVAYYPSTADRLAGMVELTLTSTGTGTCGTVQATMELTITPTPIVDAGEDIVICKDKNEIQLGGTVANANGGRWVTFGSGTFSDPLDVNARYFPSLADKDANQVVLRFESRDHDNTDCRTVSDNLRVTFTPAPTVFAGPAQTVCADIADVQLNGQITVSQGAIWTTSGTGTFVPDNTTLNARYVPSNDDRDNPGVYVLTLTTTDSGICDEISATMNLTITPRPTITPVVPTPVCADIAGVNLNANLFVATGVTWSSNGTGTFTPDANTVAATYIPSAQDTANGLVTFVAITTGNGTCNAVSASADLIITPAPTVHAGEDLLVCGNNSEVTLSGAINAVPTGAIWSGGSGTFVNGTTNTDLNAQYQPSAAEILAGQAVLRLTTTGSGSCNEVFDQMRIRITPSPTVNPGVNTSVCANNADVQLNGSVTVATGGVWSGGTGMFIPGGNTLNAIYRPSQAERDNAATVTLTLRSTGNGDCMFVERSIDVTITPAPVVNAGIDQVACYDRDDIQLSGTKNVVAAGTVWTTSGSGYFLPNASDLNARYVPSAADRDAGTVSITLTSTGSGSCLEVSDFMMLNFSPKPTITAGDDIEVCRDTDGILLNGNFTVANNAYWQSSGAGTFDNILAKKPTYIPSDAERNAGISRLIYTTMPLVTMPGADCKLYSDTVYIRYTPMPTVNVNPATTMVCADVDGIELRGTVTVATGGTWTTASGTGYFLPHANQLNTVYVPSAADTTAGQVVFTLSTTGNGTCKSYNATKTVNIRPVPIVTTGVASICADFSGAPISGNVYNASGGVWSTSGSGYFAPNEFTLDATYYPSAADMAAGLATLTLSSTGHGTCNPVNAQMTVIIKELPIADAGEDLTICENETVTLIANNVNSMPVSYNWYRISGEHISSTSLASVFVGNVPERFVLGVTDEKGCTVFDTVMVSVISRPTLYPPVHSCLEPGLVINANPDINYLGATYQWFRGSQFLPGQNNSALNVNQDGLYMVMFAYGGCFSFGFSEVTAPPAVDMADKQICIGFPTTLEASVTPAGAMYAYNWFRNGNNINNNNATIPVSGTVSGQTDVYTVEVTDIRACRTRHDVDVLTFPAPDVSLPKIDACVGDMEILNATPSNINNPLSMYDWYRNGEKLNVFTPTINITEPGQYSVIYTLGGECSTNASNIADFHAYPVTDMEHLRKECLERDPTTLDAGPAVAYLWETDNSTEKTLTTQIPGIYYVTIFNEWGCGTRDSVVLEDICPPRMNQPNALVPNGDPRDRIFRPFGKFIGKYNLTIFNRWGEIIFYSEDPEEGWDGTFRGQEMPAGVYPYILNFEPLFQEFKGMGERRSGTVTLIR